MARRLPILFLILCAVAPAFGQKVVRGVVTDAETGEPLPAANVQIEGTYRGTITNDDGAFELLLDALPATLLVRFIGYETARIPVDAGTPDRIAVRMKPTTYTLEEVVVTGEDPAVDIMRKVIARKRRWRATLETYEAEAYNRFTLENDTGIVSIVESLTKTFWDREKGGREVVLSRRKTSNLDFEEFLPAALFVKNLYDDEIEIAGYHMIGVTHPDALKHYRFTLEGTRSLDGRTVYEIAVSPKSKLASAFTGRVSVLDEAYALLSVELRPGEAFLFPPPVKRYDVTFRQQFSNFGKAYWLPVDFRSDGELEIDFQGLLTFPVIRIRQVSRLTNYEVNVPLPDSLYERKAYLAVDSTAVAADTLLDREGNAVPLTAREATAYEAIDSTMTLEKAYEPRGPLAVFVKVQSGDSNETSSGASAGRRLGDLDVSPELWYDRVDELHAALEVTAPVGRRLRVSGVGGYETGPAWWTYGGGAELRWGPHRRGMLGVRYRTGIDLRYRSEVRGRFFNGLSVLLGDPDYFDYFGNEKLVFRAGYELPKYDTRFEVRYRVERHFSVEKTTDFDLLGEPEPFRPNPAVEEGRLRSVELRLAMGDEELPLPVTGQRRLVLHVERSAPGLGSDFDFTRVHAVLDWRFETFFRRRLLPNVLDVRVVAAITSGDVPPQRFSIIDASGNLWKTYGSLRTLEHRPYEGEDAFAVFWEHNFRTVPFELLGLRGLARRGWSLIVYGAHGRTWLSEAKRRALAFSPRVPRRFHHELGVSVSGILSLFRIDFTRRLDASGFTVGVGVARIF
ncbi:DUF5686 family protein [Rhodocaloribacter sp.]